MKRDDESTTQFWVRQIQEQARRDAIEECAKFVEQHQETIREASTGSERYLSPRKVNNLMGLAYVVGIRALVSTVQVTERSDG